MKEEIYEENLEVNSTLAYLSLFTLRCFGPYARVLAS